MPSRIAYLPLRSAKGRGRAVLPRAARGRFANYVVSLPVGREGRGGRVASVVPGRPPRRGACGTLGGDVCAGVAPAVRAPVAVSGAVADARVGDRHAFRRPVNETAARLLTSFGGRA